MKSGIFAKTFSRPNEARGDLSGMPEDPDQKN